MTTKTHNNVPKHNPALHQQVSDLAIEENLNRAMADEQVRRESAHEFALKVIEWLATNRAPGGLIDGGHMFLGRVEIEQGYGGLMDIEADIETCGYGLRVLLYEGATLVYTTRIVSIAHGWYGGDRFAQLWSRNKAVTFHDLRFTSPQHFVMFLFDAAYPHATRSAKMNYTYEGVR